jgi:hypothetical protein
MSLLHASRARYHPELDVNDASRRTNSWNDDVKTCRDALSTVSGKRRCTAHLIHNGYERLDRSCGRSMAEERGIELESPTVATARGHEAGIRKLPQSTGNGTGRSVASYKDSAWRWTRSSCRTGLSSITHKGSANRH